MIGGNCWVLLAQVTGTVNPWWMAIGAYVFGVLTNPIGELITDLCRSHLCSRERKKLFLKLQQDMPVLMKEILEDLKVYPHVRECWVLPNPNVINEHTRVFHYSTKYHPEYYDNFKWLESLGLVKNIEPDNSPLCPKCKFTEELVSFLM